MSNAGASRALATLSLGALLVTLPARGAGARKPALPEPLPVAPALTALHVEVSEGGPDLPWQLRIVNGGEQPLELVADRRLLWFDVAVPGKRATVQCRLPGELQPRRAEASRKIVLAPGEAATSEIDPRLYCFSSGGQDALVPGAFVTPHFGWPEQKRTAYRKGKRVALAEAGPFVASLPRLPAPAEPTARPDPADPVPATELKAVHGQGFALRSSYSSWASARLTTHDAAEATAPLLLELRGGSDADSIGDVTITASVRNVSGSTQWIFLRPDLLRLEVVSAEGTSTCTPEPSDRAPASGASFTRLAPGASTTLVSRLRELCSEESFEHAGLYLVHARLESVATGDEYGLDAFVGKLASPRPAAVRLRRGEAPMHVRPMQVTPAAPASAPARSAEE